MKCEYCGQRSDWLGRNKGWDPVHPGQLAIHALYECRGCGNKQHIR